MEEYSEAFVAFDVAEKKHAVALAEGGRTGEVRFVGEIENNPAAIERTIKRLGKGTIDCTSASRPGRRGMGYAGRFAILATTAWW